MRITRAEAPVWTSKVLVEEAMLDRLLAHISTISFKIRMSTILLSYFVFCAYGVARCSCTITHG